MTPEVTQTSTPVEPEPAQCDVWLDSLPVGVPLTEFQRGQCDALHLLYPERVAPQENPS